VVGSSHCAEYGADKTVITGFAGVIWLDANIPNFNATRCQMYGATANAPCTGSNVPFAGSGLNFLLTDNSDPLLYLNNQYNYYHVPTDFEYVGVHKEFGKGFIFEMKNYTYNYDNSEKYSNAVPITDDPTLVGTTYATLGVKITAICKNQPKGCGVDKYNSYRKYGETSQLSQVSRFGIFRKLRCRLSLYSGITNRAFLPDSFKPPMISTISLVFGAFN